jgi:hypothetical protein
MAFAYDRQREQVPASETAETAQSAGPTTGPADEQAAWGNAAAAEALPGVAPGVAPDVLGSGPDTGECAEEGAEPWWASEDECEGEASANMSPDERRKEREVARQPFVIFSEEIARPGADGDRLYDLIMRMARPDVMRVRGEPAWWSKLQELCSEQQLQLIQERIAVLDEEVREDSEVFFALSIMQRRWEDGLKMILSNLDYGELQYGRYLQVPSPDRLTTELTLTEETRNNLLYAPDAPVTLAMRLPALEVIPIEMGWTQATIRVRPHPLLVGLKLKAPVEWELYWSVPDFQLPRLSRADVPDVVWFS